MGVVDVADVVGRNNVPEVVVDVADGSSVRRIAAAEEVIGVLREAEAVYDVRVRVRMIHVPDEEGSSIHHHYHPESD